jgi:hypothetical protein
MRPETFGPVTPQRAPETADWRLQTEITRAKRRKCRAIPDAMKLHEFGATSWWRSQSRETSLRRPNSLLTGKITGKSQEFELRTEFSRRIEPLNQLLIRKFPRELNREFNSQNRESSLSKAVYQGKKMAGETPSQRRGYAVALDRRHDPLCRSNSSNLARKHVVRTPSVSWSALYARRVPAAPVVKSAREPFLGARLPVWRSRCRAYPTRTPWLKPTRSRPRNIRGPNR